MTEAEFAATREYLARWIAVADAPTAAERAERLNALLAAATAHPRLTDHDGTWHLHFRDDDRPPAAIVAAILSAGTALHLVGRGNGQAGPLRRGRLRADLRRHQPRRQAALLLAGVRQPRRGAPPPGPHDGGELNWVAEWP